MCPQDGTSLKDRLFASALCKDGSVVLAGYSEGNWAEANAGGSDLAAVKLDVAVGTEIWRWQVRMPVGFDNENCPCVTPLFRTGHCDKSQASEIPAAKLRPCRSKPWPPLWRAE